MDILVNADRIPLDEVEDDVPAREIAVDSEHRSSLL
jgi:hypothetical protein